VEAGPPALHDLRPRAARLQLPEVLDSAAVRTLAAAFGLLACAAAAPASGSFDWLVPAPAPAGWKHVTLPSGHGVLSYPASFERIEAGPGGITAAQFDAKRHYLAYLNAGPRRGGGDLASWAAFRLKVLHGKSNVSVHGDASARNLRFRGGTGSCVIDAYVTTIGHHHYREIACLVIGHGTANVVVAAAPQSRWAKTAALLQRAIAAYAAT
jgi:hypothetical protein